MKNYKNPSTSKLVARFDNKLKTILMEDLKAFKTKHQFINSNQQELAQARLSA